MLNWFTLILIGLILLVISISIFVLKKNKMGGALIIGVSLIVFASYIFLNGMMIDQGWSGIMGSALALLFGVPGAIIISVVGYKKLRK